jgi:hypothetical protein
VACSMHGYITGSLCEEQTKKLLLSHLEHITGDYPLDRQRSFAKRRLSTIISEVTNAHVPIYITA